MIRRIVCLFLVPALFANQAAICFAHQHRGLETDDHAARTHVHLFGHCHQTDAGDHHHGDPCGHRHSNEQGPSDDESDSGFDPSCPPDHDTNAIFFGEQDLPQTHPNRLTFEVSTYFVICFVAEMPRTKSTIEWSSVSRAGPFLPYHCAIYLQTRCLLI